MADEGPPVVLMKNQDGSVVTVRLNRPSSLNSLNRQLVADLAAAFEGISRDENVRAVILTVSSWVH